VLRCPVRQPHEAARRTRDCVAAGLPHIASNEHSQMKFILVNHRTPLNTATCTECERSLGTGYLREVSSQRQYCDHDCYLRYQTKSLFMPWLTISRGDRMAAPHPTSSPPPLPPRPAGIRFRSPRRRCASAN